MLATSAHTTLRRGCSRIRTFVLTQKHIFELDHPRIGEKQGGIIPRNQRTGRHDSVPFGFVETEKLFPDFGAFHNGEVLMQMRILEDESINYLRRDLLVATVGSG